MRDHIKLNQTPPAAEQSAQQQQQDAILAVVVARHLGAMKEHWQHSVVQLGAAHQGLAGQASPPRCMMSPACPAFVILGLNRLPCGMEQSALCQRGASVAAPIGARRSRMFSFWVGSAMQCHTTQGFPLAAGWQGVGGRSWQQQPESLHAPAARPGSCPCAAGTAGRSGGIYSGSGELPG